MYQKKNFRLNNTEDKAVVLTVKENFELLGEDSISVNFLEENLQKIRSHVIRNELEEALKLRNYLALFEAEMNDVLCYYFQKYTGNIAYANEEYAEALTYYQKAEERLNNTPESFSEKEIADLHYSIGLAAYHTSNPCLVFSHTEKALSIYSKGEKGYRVPECYVNLSLAEKQSLNFRSSLEYLKKAVEACETNDYALTKFTIKFNYAYTFLQFHDYEKVIEYTNDCIQYLSAEQNCDRLLCYSTLIKAYLGLDDIFAAKEVIVKADEVIGSLTELLKNENSLNDIVNEYIGLRAYVLEDNELYENHLVHKVLPRIEELGHEYELNYYSYQLGKFYLKTNQSEKMMEVMSKLIDRKQKTT